MLCRRERPQRGAQFTIFDEHGYRCTCFLTDQPTRTSPRWSCATAESDGFAWPHRDGAVGPDQTVVPNRRRARVEDRIRACKATGMRNLAHHVFEHNQTSLELSLVAQDLLGWTRLTCLEGELATADPNRLRHRLLHTAGKIVRQSRRTQLKLDRDWHWSETLAATLTGLRAIPALC